MTFQYCRCKLKSVKPLVTLELSSTASCHYRHMLLRFVELDSFTSDNYVQLFDQWQPPPPKQQSRRLSAVVWTTATPCCTACQTAFCGRFSPSRTPPHVWSQELDDATTSHRCCDGASLQKCSRHDNRTDYQPVGQVHWWNYWFFQEHKRLLSLVRHQTRACAVSRRHKTVCRLSRCNDDTWRLTGLRTWNTVIATCAVLEQHSAIS